MGHTVAGVVGAAAASRRKAVALVGDGAMLMNLEINTAVKYTLPAVWVVLNDGCYNMVDQVLPLLRFDRQELGVVASLPASRHASGRARPAAPAPV